LSTRLVVGEGPLGLACTLSKDYRENESRLAGMDGIDELLAIVDIVPIAGDLSIMDGLKPKLVGGFVILPRLPLSFNYLFR